MYLLEKFFQTEKLMNVEEKDELGWPGEELLSEIKRKGLKSSSNMKSKWTLSMKYDKVNWLLMEVNVYKVVVKVSPVPFPYNSSTTVVKIV